MDGRLAPSADRRFHALKARTVRSLGLGSIAITFGLAACGHDDAPGAVSSGADLYADRCASCHGSDLRGTDLGPSLLSEIYEPNRFPDESIRAAVREGVQPRNWQFGPMPAIAGLDDDEVTAIIGDIREVQQRDGFEPYPPE